MHDLPSAFTVGATIRDEMRRRGALVVLDYDGTLAPIAPRPELAQIPPETRAAVARLATRATVAVLSGRGLDDVARCVALDGLFYGGCHGLELRGPGLSYGHEPAAVLRAELDGAASSLQRALASVRGALVEHKGLAIAVHRRLVEPAHHPAVEQAVERIAKRHPRLRRARGKMVDELVPDVAWDKGAALDLLRGRLGDDGVVLYLGDDRTDEDAFRALGAAGFPILVANEPRETAARYRLSDTDEVQRFIAALADAE
jgi:trehalose 6-phosphate phosphatase